MRNILTIAGKEIRSYFGSPMAYVVTAVFLVMTGYFFADSLGGRFAQANIRGFLLIPAPYILVVLAPLLSMRLFAEEAKMGTLELLLTAPVRDYHVVIGKYLASVVVLASMIGLTIYYPILLMLLGFTPDLGPVVSGYVGLFLLGMAFLSVGIFTSSLTNNQIVAAVLTVGILLLLTVFYFGSTYLLGISADIIGYLAWFPHFRDFAFGIIDTKDVIYFVSIAAAFLLFTVQSVSARRWR